MNKIISAIMALLCITFNVYAHEETAPRTVCPALLQGLDINGDKNIAPITMRQRIKSQEAESSSISVTTTRAGELDELLGDKVTQISELSVAGPINAEDFNTMWNSTFHGHLKVIDLGNASVENGIIPDHALFHIDEQMDWSTLTVTTIWLEKLVLPDNITEIGDFAFAYAISLTDVNFPSALRYIGKSAFTDCILLTSDKLQFGEQLEKLDAQAFYQCKGLIGSIRLPESLKWIDQAAFYVCKITKINIPKSLEYLGCDAFHGSRFTTAILPDDCYLCPHGGQFYNNWELTEVHLPNNMEFVPESVVQCCISLNKVNVPAKAVVIGEFAFDQTKIEEIEIPESVVAIKQDAFQSCHKLHTIVLPSSLSELGDNVFNLCSSLRSIYCKGEEPPICTEGIYGDKNPFSSLNTSLPVYIPIGTRDKYLSAPGWSYFTNFIETDDFPSAGIDDVLTDKQKQDTNVYDLYGRRVEILVLGNIYIQHGRKFICK